jgi:hypothetical protein
MRRAVNRFPFFGNGWPVGIYQPSAPCDRINHMTRPCLQEPTVTGLLVRSSPSRMLALVSGRTPSAGCSQATSSSAWSSSPPLFTTVTMPPLSLVCSLQLLGRLIHLLSLVSTLSLLLRDWINLCPCALPRYTLARLPIALSSTHIRTK